VPYFLDAAADSLTRTRPADASHLAYDSTQQGAAARFDLTFTEDTEITGYAMTKLWISLNGADDGDLFVALQKVDVTPPTQLATSVLR
jgi:predicted acyl esterase